MKRMMLIGECGSGKENIIRALAREKYVPRKAMSVEYCGPFVDIPGEFLENRRFYSALISLAGECAVLAFVQNATRRNSLFPPRFAAMFNRTVVGVITHADAAAADLRRAERFLRNAGVRDCIPFAHDSGEGLEEVRSLLAPLNSGVRGSAPAAGGIYTQR
jgi:ethanolamine utilization protein EutP